MLYLVYTVCTEITYCHPSLRHKRYTKLENVAGIHVGLADIIRVRVKKESEYLLKLASKDPTMECLDRSGGDNEML